MEFPKTVTPVPTTRAGWTIDDFAAATGISRSMIYALPAERQPKSLKFGRRRVIVEQPADYLARLGAEAQP
jgi:hypothetical protein